MFIVISRTDTVRLPPTELGRDVHDLLSDEIDSKYANRVIPDIGLAVSLFAIDNVMDPFVLPGDGGAHVHGTWYFEPAGSAFSSYQVGILRSEYGTRAPPCSLPSAVDFRLLVFRPFDGELVDGVVKSVDRQRGVQVDLSFFDQVYVEPAHLRPEMEWMQSASDIPPGAPRDPASVAALKLPTWVWIVKSEPSETGEGDGSVALLPCRVGDTLRIRVNKVLFSEPASRTTLPRGTPGLGIAAAASSSAAGHPSATTTTAAGRLLLNDVASTSTSLHASTSALNASDGGALRGSKSAAGVAVAPGAPTALAVAASRMGRPVSELVALGSGPPVNSPATASSAPVAPMPGSASSASGVGAGAASKPSLPSPAEAAAAAAAARANDGAHLPPLPSAVRLSLFAPKTTTPAPRLLQKPGDSAAASLAFMVNATRNRAGGPVQRSYTSAQLMTLYGGDTGVNMALFGVMMEDGLGPHDWWDRSEPERSDTVAEVEVGPVA